MMPTDAIVSRTAVRLIAVVLPVRISVSYTHFTIEGNSVGIELNGPIEPRTVHGGEERISQRESLYLNIKPKIGRL